MKRCILVLPLDLPSAYPSRHDETFLPLPLLASKVSRGCFKGSQGEWTEITSSGSLGSVWDLCGLAPLRVTVNTINDLFLGWEGIHTCRQNPFGMLSTQQTMSA